jgi:hypothetical protein
MKIDTIGDYEAATQQRLIEQAEADMREGRMPLVWCDDCYLYAAKTDVHTGNHELAHAYLSSYSIAVAMESGDWDIVEGFTAATDAEARHDHLEWYVLDSSGVNINA